MAQKTILITGCSSGIGFDAALRLRAQGWRVFASCRAPEDVERLQAEGFESLVLDYADELEQQPCWVTQKRAAAGFVELAEAYSVLSNEQKRRDYDDGKYEEKFDSNFDDVSRLLGYYTSRVRRG